MSLYQQNAIPKFSWSQVLLRVLISVSCLLRKESYSPRTPKVFVPITPPLNLLADFYHLFSQRVKHAEIGPCCDLSHRERPLNPLITTLYRKQGNRECPKTRPDGSLNIDPP